MLKGQVRATRNPVFTAGFATLAGTTAPAFAVGGIPSTLQADDAWIL
jgi:hypothetical protein